MIKKFIRTGETIIIAGVEVTPTTIINTYKTYYPDTWEQINKQNLFHYTHLFGIRASTDNPFMADDVVGAIRITNANYYEFVNSYATTEPATKALSQLFDAEARSRGGAAYVMEGQYAYYFMPTREYTNKSDKSGFIAYVRGKRHNFSPHAFFCPVKPVSVYGWRPNEVVRSQKSEKDWTKTHIINGITYKGFKDSLLDYKNGRPSNIKASTSRDTCIHRRFSTGENLERYDSAGCQVLKDHFALNTMGDWAVEHIKKGYTRTFIYTLFTLEQFLNANRPDFSNLFKIWR